VLGVATIFLSLMSQKQMPVLRKILFAIPLLLICICYFITNETQWQIAPFRKEGFLKMAANLIQNKNLEVLQGNNADITNRAREVLIKNNLNVFSGGKKLNNYSVEG